MTAQRGDSGQVEAFPEPPRVPTPVHRPDGRLYRPRKLPEPMLLSDEDGTVVGVCVMRTHSDSTSRQLALAELAAYDSAFEWVLDNGRAAWGRWRPDGDEGRRAWVPDDTGLTGTPAVFFDAEQP